MTETVNGRPVKNFVAMFVPLSICALPEEMGLKGTGVQIPGFTHEGMTVEPHLVTEVMEGHNCVTVEPGRKAHIFATRAEAEAFVEAQTVRKSGWMVLPRT
jgi:hypothetical protein